MNPSLQRPADFCSQLGREHQDASASDISAILPGRMQEMMWVVRLIDHQCLDSKPEPTPVFLAIGLFCLFLDKVNQKKGGRKYLEDGSKYTSAHMSSHK